MALREDAEVIALLVDDDQVAQGRDPATTTLTEVMTSNLVTVLETTSVADVGFGAGQSSR